MDTPQHPGEILHQQFMEPRGISTYALAKSLHFAESSITNVVNGQRPISLELAKKLERAFGLSAQDWLALQHNFEQSQRLSA